MLYGIDLSHWNSISSYSNFVDNKTNNKIDFVILKVSQYITKDNMFDTMYDNVKDKYRVGAYIYNKATSVREAEVEAKFAVQCLKGKDMKAWVWLDMEDAKLKNIGKANLTNIIKTEADIIKSAGYNVGIYCNLDWYKNILDSTNLKKDFKFWIARYPSTDTGIVKDSLNPKTYEGVAMWQYSSKGSVKGISGNVDLDMLYDDIFAIQKVEVEKTETFKEVTKYVVKSGDTLSKIGDKLKVKWQDIATLNNIKSPYTIKVGQILVVPTTNITNNAYYPKYSGAKTTLVNALKYLNIESSYNFRKTLAKANGISLYVGTAKQNNQLYDLLTKGKLKRV